MQPHARSCTHASVTTVLFGTVRTIHNMCLLSQTPNGLLHTNNKHRNVLVGTFLIHSHWAHKTNDMHCNVHKNCNIPQSNFPTQLLKNKLCCNHFQLYVHVLHLPLRCALMRHQRFTLLHTPPWRICARRLSSQILHCNCRTLALMAFCMYCTGSFKNSP